MKPEGREIKRTGHMYGTRMYKARNWFILGSFGFVILCGFGITKFFFDPEKERKARDRISAQREEWEVQIMQRELEVRLRRMEQARKLSRVISTDVNVDRDENY